MLWNVNTHQQYVVYHFRYFDLFGIGNPLGIVYAGFRLSHTKWLIAGRPASFFSLLISGIHSSVQVRVSCTNALCHMP